MTDEDAGTVDATGHTEPTDSRQRVNALIQSLLEDETLSEDARNVLRHLQETPEDLVAMAADELGTVLLEGLS